MHTRPENKGTAHVALQNFFEGFTEPFCNLATLYLEMTVTSGWSYSSQCSPVVVTEQNPSYNLGTLVYPLEPQNPCSNGVAKQN